jgi:hypothetical protein
VATLVIDGTTVNVRAGAIPKLREDTATYRRRWGSGEMDMEVRGAFGRVRSWEPTTKPMTQAESDTLKAIIEAVGTRTVTGDTAGAGATCFSGNFRRRWLTPTLVEASFRLDEVGG